MQTLTEIIHFDKLQLQTNEEMKQLLSFLDEAFILNAIKIISNYNTKINIALRGDLNVIYRQLDYQYDFYPLLKYNEPELRNLSRHVHRFLEQHIETFYFQTEDKVTIERHCLNFNIIPISRQAILLSIVCLKL